MSGAHEMVPGGFGHATSHCKHCSATEREIAFALGPVCPSAPTPSTTPSQRLDAATVERCACEVCQEALNMETIRRVARAMCDRVNGQGDYDENPERHAGWNAQAEAAITALATEPHQHGGKGA